MKPIQSSIKIACQQGFTLVQLLFVIAIIAAITVASFHRDEDVSREHNARRAAVEMQRYFEAATDYYKKNALWPTDFSQLVAGEFIPPATALEGGYVNPWGYPYELIPVKGERGDTFAISNRVPHPATRQRLSRELPNGTVDEDRVIASITSANKDNSPIFVGAERNIQSDAGYQCGPSQTGCLSSARQQYYENLCRQQYGRKADFDVALQSFNAGEVPFWSNLFKLFDGNSYYNFRDISIRPSIERGHWGFRLTLDREAEVIPGNHGQAVMFVYCQPIEVQNHS